MCHSGTSGGFSPPDRLGTSASDSKLKNCAMIGANFVQLAEQAIKEQRSHIGYLEALLTMESEERDRHAIQPTDRTRDE